MNALRLEGADFPGDPVVKNPSLYCREQGFDPWLGNYDPTCLVVRSKKKKRERLQRVNKLTKILINKLKKIEESNMYQERRHGSSVSLSPCFSLCVSVAWLFLSYVLL